MNSRLTSTQRRLIRTRYPLEGASESLCRDAGMQPWQVRYIARRLGVKLAAKVRKKQNQRFTTGSHESMP